MSVYVVISIGCIECGHDNLDAVVGVFGSKAKAAAEVARLRGEGEEREEHNYSKFGTPKRLRDSECGGFSMSDWQVRLVETSVT